MRSLTYALAALPGFASPKTYAAWPVWRDSTTKEVRFVPMLLKQAAKHWQKARRFDRQTHIAWKHGGLIGRTALAVLYALLFDFRMRVAARSVYILQRSHCCCRRLGAESPLGRSDWRCAGARGPPTAIDQGREGHTIKGGSIAVEWQPSRRAQIG
jgi:hypothetical protein